MTTQIPELLDETDDMKTIIPELEKEITTMQMIIDSVSEITTMVPESVPEMVPTDTRDKMPRLDDEGKIYIQYLKKDNYAGTLISKCGEK